MEFLNEHSFKSLEFEYILNMLLPVTPYGIQRKRELRPYLRGEENELNRDYDVTEKLITLMQKHTKEIKEISSILKGFKEIRHSLKRAAEGYVLDEIELFEIKEFLFLIRDVREVQGSIQRLPEELVLCRIKELEELLDPERHGNRSFYIYDSYSEILSKIRNRKRELQRKFELERKKIISFVEESLGERLKLSGEVTIPKGDKERIKRAEACPHLSQGAATMLQVTYRLKNNEKLESLLMDIENLKQEENSEEFRVKKHLSSKISEYKSKFSELFDKLGTLDFFISKAEFAIAIGGIRPVLHSEDKIIIRGGRHLKLEAILKEKVIPFSPISLCAEKGVTIITGANMGGKTVNLKLTGILAAMAQYGLFVPAEEFKTCLFEYIYFSIGDMQSINTGLSTFGSEISGMIEMLEYSHRYGLILIDELARGTNPEEGYAISRAIVGFLKNSNVIALFTTHFDGITGEAGVRHFRVKGLSGVDFEKMKLNKNNEEFSFDRILKLMDYTLEEATGHYEVPRDAINIARLMGMDEKILNYAEELLNEGKGDNNGKA